jgi:cytochrome c oxidase cbb3-type subunit 3
MNRDPQQEQLLDHNYDGIQEYDNPLPKWWVYIFYATIVFSVLYWFNVPGIGSGKGRVANYEQEMEKARAQQAQLAAKNPVVQDTDATLMASMHDPAVMALGKEVFVGTCAVCHRPDGGGNIGPNLTDEYWIHGGKPTEILNTVTTGVLEKGMPAWGQTLPPEKVRAAAIYVLSMQGSHPESPKAAQGTKLEESPAGGEPGEAKEGEKKSEGTDKAAESHS